jgi:hypothetical protein
MIFRIVSSVAYGSAISGALAEFFIALSPFAPEVFSGLSCQDPFILRRRIPASQLMQDSIAKDNCAFGHGEAGLTIPFMTSCQVSRSRRLLML